MDKIGFISPYEKGCAIARELADSVGVELVCRVSVGIGALQVAEEMFEDEQVRVIIDRYPTSELLTKHFGNSIVEVSLSDYSLIKVLSKAREVDRNVTYVTLKGHGAQGADIGFLEQLLDIRISVVEIFANGDQESVARSMKESGVKTAVSAASCMLPFCRDLGIQMFLIPLDPTALLQAIKSAAAIASVKGQLSKVRSYIDHEPDALVVVNKRNVIQMYNEPLTDMIGVRGEGLAGKSLSRAASSYPLLDQLAANRNVFRHNGRMYYAARFDFDVDNRPLTAIRIVQLDQDSPVASVASEAKPAARCKGAGFAARYRFADIAGKSKPIVSAKKNAEHFAGTDSSILITGESGTGKELFAQSIHNASRWANGPFIALNCAALPENLIESELYGYEDGAFTGARKGGKAGLFELSHGGTLFLDEIGEMPIEHQARLLRSLQERQIVRVGGTRPIRIENRIICATNRNLPDEISEGRFREDLYYRINVLSVEIPPLRTRPEDIGDFVQAFIRTHPSAAERRIVFSPAQIAAMQEYDWPGNVRELFNFLESVIVTSSSDKIKNEHFRSFLSRIRPQGGLAEKKSAPARPSPQNEKLNDLNLEFIRRKYEECNYNTQATADALGISRTTLWRKLKKAANG